MTTIPPHTHTHKDVLRGIAILPNGTDEGSDVVVVRDEFNASAANRSDM